MKSTHSFASGMAARGVFAALFAASLALACAACGQRGPLYLPETEPAPESTAPAEEAAREGETEASDTSGDATDDEDSQ